MNHIRYFSSLTPAQKDKTHKTVCRVISNNSTKFITPELWGVLFDVSFDEIIATKNEADRYCKGKCFLHKNTWIPLSISSHKKQA